MLSVAVLRHMSHLCDESQPFRRRGPSATAQLGVKDIVIGDPRDQDAHIMGGIAAQEAVFMRVRQVDIIAGPQRHEADAVSRIPFKKGYLRA